MYKRILFLEALSTISGGQKVLLDLLRNNFPYEAHVMIPAHGSLSDELTALGCTVHIRKMHDYTLVHKSRSDQWQYLQELPVLTWQTRQLAKQLDVSLIYANASRNFVWGTAGAMLARRPIIWHVHNMIADQSSRQLISTVAKLPVRKHLICVCDAARQQYPYVSDRASVIYNGLDANKYQFSPVDRNNVRQSFSIPDKAFVIGIVGDITPHKGQHLLLEAVKNIGGKRSVFILIVGVIRPNDESESYLQTLHQLATDLPTHVQVIFSGRRNDMSAIYSALDVLVVASTNSETTSLVMQEAMLCQRPVVVSQVGGIPELVRSGQNGLLFRIGDVAQLTASLQMLCDESDLGNAMGQEGFRMASRKFLLSDMRKRVVETIDQLI